MAVAETAALLREVAALVDRPIRGADGGAGASTSFGATAATGDVSTSALHTSEAALSSLEHRFLALQSKLSMVSALTAEQPLAGSDEAGLAAQLAATAAARDECAATEAEALRLREEVSAAAAASATLSTSVAATRARLAEAAAMLAKMAEAHGSLTSTLEPELAAMVTEAEARSHVSSTMIATAEAQAEALRLSMEVLAMEEGVRQFDAEAAALHKDTALLEEERERVSRTTLTKAQRCDEAAHYYETMTRLLAATVGTGAVGSRGAGGYGGASTSEGV